MKDQNNFYSSIEGINGSLLAVLQQGAEIIEKLDDTSFTDGNCSSIGVHFRHCLDFLANFFDGIEAGKIDYSKRERSLNLETNRKLAISALNSAIEKTQNLTKMDLEKQILVKLEELESEIWANSSVLRELDFVQSHTIHHFALIAYKLHNLGIEVSEEFGVAPSTLKFWKEEKAKAA